MTAAELEAIANALARQAPDLDVDALIVVAVCGDHAYSSAFTRLPGGTRAAMMLAADCCVDALNQPARDKPIAEGGDA